MHLTVILRDAFADWEVSILTATVTESFGGTVGYHSPEAPRITSIGGLRTNVLPLEEMPGHTPLALCGSALWFEGDGGIGPNLDARLAEGLPVGGIGAGAFALARHSALEDRHHTGNSAEELQRSGYGGGGFYHDQPVMSERGVVTSPAIAPGEFALGMLRLMTPLDEEVRETMKQVETMMGALR